MLLMHYLYTNCKARIHTFLSMFSQMSNTTKADLDSGYILFTTHCKQHSTNNLFLFKHDN